MNTLYENKQIKYTYKLTSGISTIKGGLQVLYDLDYPSSIIDDANKILVLPQ